MLNAQGPVPSRYFRELGGLSSRPPTKKAPATTGAFRALNDVNSLQRLEPVVHILVDLVLGEAVALLQLAFELFAAPFDHVEIVVGEFAPLFLRGALEFLPVALTWFQ